MNKGDVWPLSFRLVHWTSAALVIAALGLGTYMMQLVHDPAERFELTQTHKSIGITVLALTVVRLCLRIFTRAPQPEPAAPFVRLAAKAAHIVLYALLLVMPLSGWLIATTTPVRVPTFVFGLVELPYPLSPDLAAYRIAHTIHVVSAIFLAFLIVLHVAAAIIHAFLWHDRTLARMWRGRSSAA
jgi:cytochrome b561